MAPGPLALLGAPLKIPGTLEQVVKPPERHRGLYNILPWFNIQVSLPAVAIPCHTLLPGRSQAGAKGCYDKHATEFFFVLAQLESIENQRNILEMSRSQVNV